MVLKEWFDPDAVRRVGSTPDYRFSLANERTFLAWIRTGLALVAGGLAIAQLLPELRVPYLREALGSLLMVGGGLVALRALHHWVRVERAIRQGEELPRSRFPAFLAIGIGVGALALIGIVIFESAAG